MSKHTQWCHTDNRPWSMKTGCHECHRPLSYGDRLCVVTTEVSEMRGDDEVEFLCEWCAKKRGL